MLGTIRARERAREDAFRPAEVITVMVPQDHAKAHFAGAYFPSNLGPGDDSSDDMTTTDHVWRKKPTSTGPACYVYHDEESGYWLFTTKRSMVGTEYGGGGVEIRSHYQAYEEGDAVSGPHKSVEWMWRATTGKGKKVWRLDSKIKVGKMSKEVYESARAEMGRKALAAAFNEGKMYRGSNLPRKVAEREEFVDDLCTVQ